MINEIALGELVYQDGKLLWSKTKPGVPLRKNRVAGSVNKDGYISIKTMEREKYAHRIIWEYFNGEIPKGMTIDHINHDKSDNRIENLRLATYTENNRNQGLSKRNKSGFAGVFWENDRGKWRASIQVDGKHVRLGSFHSKEEAIMARLKGEEIYGFHKNHCKPRVGHDENGNSLYE